MYAAHSQALDGNEDRISLHGLLEEVCNDELGIDALWRSSGRKSQLFRRRK